MSAPRLTSLGASVKPRVELAKKAVSAETGRGNQIIAGFERLGHVLKAQAWSQAMAAGLTPTQGQVLGVLRAHKGEGLRLGDIAVALQVTPATASEAVGTLVAKGLVKKVPSPKDARAIRLSLTDAGQREALAASRWPDFLLEVVEDLAEADQVAVLRAVLTLIASLQQRGLVPVARMCISCRYFDANAHPGEVLLHHCNLLNAPVGDGDLRVHCPEQEPAPEALVAENFGRFVELRRGATGPALGKKRVRGGSSR